MTTPKIDGRTLRRADTKQVILDAALGLFAARGVTSTSVDDIASAAGIAKGSIYYNFGSKDNLVEELLVLHGRRLVESLQAAAAPGPQGRRAILGALLDDLAEHPDVAQLIVQELFRSDRHWIDVVARWREDVTRPLVENLVAELGEDRRRYAQFRAAALVGAGLTAGLQWLLFDPQADRQIVLDAIEGV